MLVGLVITGPMVALAEGVPATARRQRVERGLRTCRSGQRRRARRSRTAALRIGQVALVAPLVSAEGAIAAVIALLAGESLAPGSRRDARADRRRRLRCRRSRTRIAHPDERPGTSSGRAIAFAVAAAITFGASLYATGRAGAIAALGLGRALGAPDRHGRARDPVRARRTPAPEPRARTARRRVGSRRGARASSRSRPDHDTGLPLRRCSRRSGRRSPPSRLTSCSGSGSAASSSSGCARSSWGSRC